MMNAVVYYSNSNESYKVAKYLSDKSTYQFIDLKSNDVFQFDNLILVFPYVAITLILFTFIFFKKYITSSGMF